MKITLDGFDITEELTDQQGYDLPPDPTGIGGIYPSKDSGAWFDLLRVINSRREFRDGFFDGGYENGTHTLIVTDDEGREFDCRLLLRKKYTARNR